MFIDIYTAIFIGLVILIITAIRKAFKEWIKNQIIFRLPSPERVNLIILNIFKKIQYAIFPPANEKFRIVLCWLDDDEKGINTRIVAKAFRGISGIELIRSARIVSAWGAADDWKPQMRKHALRILNKWNANLALVGEVNTTVKTLNLWFIPREGDGTLHDPNKSIYRIIDANLQIDFHEALNSELLALTFSIVASQLSTEKQGQELIEQLKDIANKIEYLIKGNSITDPDRPGILHGNYGNVLFELGIQENNTKRFQQAVGAFRKALLHHSHQDGTWIMFQNNLGNTLRQWGEKENSIELLQEAREVYESALAILTPENTPEQWAVMQYNLSGILATLGRTNNNIELLNEAIRTLREALRGFVYDHYPYEWIAAQTNLGSALTIMGEMNKDAEQLWQAIDAYREILDRVTENSMDWAIAQNGIGGVFIVLAKREQSKKYYEQAISAFRNATKGLSHEKHSHLWIIIHNNLGKAFMDIYEIDKDPNNFKQAIAAYRETDNDHYKKQYPREWFDAQMQLGNALTALDNVIHNAKYSKEAITIFQKLSKEELCKQCPQKWAEAQHNLGNAFLILQGHENKIENLKRAINAYEAALQIFTLEQTPDKWRKAKVLWYYTRYLLKDING